LVFQASQSAWGIAIHQHFHLIAVSCNAHSIRIWDLRNDQDRKRDLAFEHWEVQQLDLLGHADNIPDIDFDDTGQYLASASIDQTCRIWNVKSGECIFVVHFPEWYK
jgi:WD40 repeat protein